ncbi:unnamed protein product [Vitrella brassicaformis CCMP3155]|uniref:Kinesin motor domain-containing protein n=2 Tax=Vitrella brassicaformis TaxID=1169539 RepID=A0A0G4EHL4_VITBC|nr:unnamed protein product [Vitrella brassicaformis CCMP3155]|eukprot:CEL95675.1 unnamed protein product [Vitrella brassicaformis CCMP3155]
MAPKAKVASPKGRAKAKPGGAKGAEAKGAPTLKIERGASGTLQRKTIAAGERPMLDRTGTDTEAPVPERVRIEQRRRSVSKDESIRVTVRMRPLFSKETSKGHQQLWKIENEKTVTSDPSMVIEPEILPAGPLKTNAFSFDNCLDGTVTNDEMYECMAKDVVLDAIEGINGCVLSYGQTGSGKTFSTMGTMDQPGIIPQALDDIFFRIANSEDETTEYLVRCAYVEIYMERVNDLFQDGPDGENSPMENLQVKEDPGKGFYVVGLAEKIVGNADDVLELLRRAEKKRRFARTNFNDVSSRSHVVFIMIIETSSEVGAGAEKSTITKAGRLNLVDLAGNEKVSQAAAGTGGAQEKKTMDEGKRINQSLFFLSEVIGKLSARAEIIQKKGSAKAAQRELESLYVPYRDSKLTRLLQNSLGGNSRCSLLIAVTPSHMYQEETLSSLRFAAKAKKITVEVQTNFVSPEQSVIAQQKETIRRLEEQLQRLQEGGGVPQAPAGSLVAPPPPSSEEVDQLKEEMKSKLDRLTNLILKQDVTSPKDSASKTMPSAKMRRMTMAGPQGGGRGGFAGFAPGLRGSFLQELIKRPAPAKKKKEEEEEEESEEEEEQSDEEVEEMASVTGFDIDEMLEKIDFANLDEQKKIEKIKNLIMDKAEEAKRANTEARRLSAKVKKLRKISDKQKKKEKRATVVVGELPTPSAARKGELGAEIKERKKTVGFGIGMAPAAEPTTPTTPKKTASLEKLAQKAVANVVKNSLLGLAENKTIPASEQSEYRLAVQHMMLGTAPSTPAAGARARLSDEKGAGRRVSHRHVDVGEGEPKGVTSTVRVALNCLAERPEIPEPEKESYHQSAEHIKKRFPLDRGITPLVLEQKPDDVIAGLQKANTKLIEERDELNQRAAKMQEEKARLLSEMQDLEKQLRTGGEAAIGETSLANLSAKLQQDLKRAQDVPEGTTSDKREALLGILKVLEDKIDQLRNLQRHFRDKLSGVPTAAAAFPPPSPFPPVLQGLPTAARRQFVTKRSFLPSPCFARRAPPAPGVSSSLPPSPSTKTVCCGLRSPREPQPRDVKPKARGGVPPLNLGVMSQPQPKWSPPSYREEANLKMPFPSEEPKAVFSPRPPSPVPVGFATPRVTSTVVMSPPPADVRPVQTARPCYVSVFCGPPRPQQPASAVRSFQPHPPCHPKSPPAPANSSLPSSPLPPPVLTMRPPPQSAPAPTVQHMKASAPQPASVSRVDSPWPTSRPATYRYVMGPLSQKQGAGRVDEEGVKRDLMRQETSACQRCCISHRGARRDKK